MKRIEFKGLIYIFMTSRLPVSEVGVPSKHSSYMTGNTLPEGGEHLEDTLGAYYVVDGRQEIGIDIALG